MIIEKIKKFLLKQGMALSCEAETGSLYFKKDKIKIRLSNHVGFDHRNLLSIIIPSNFDMFIAFLNGQVIILKNYDKLKNFIKYYILITNVYKETIIEDFIKQAISEKTETAYDILEKTITKCIESKVQALTQCSNSQEQELLTLFRNLPEKYKLSAIKSILNLTKEATKK